VRSFCGVVWATVPTKVDALPYLDLVAPSQKWRKSSLDSTSALMPSPAKLEQREAGDSERLVRATAGPKNEGARSPAARR